MLLLELDCKGTKCVKGRKGNAKRPLSYAGNDTDTVTRVEANRLNLVITQVAKFIFFLLAKN